MSGIEKTVEIHFQNTQQGRAAKRQRIQTYVIVSLLLVLIVSVITVLVLVEKTNTNASNSTNTDETKDSQMCHYADSVFPIDVECGDSYCVDNNIQRSFILSSGWSNQLLNARNQTAMDMLRYLEDHNVCPNILELNDVSDNEQYITYNNNTIALLTIHISVEYFCCYDDAQYNQILALYEGYNWNAFDIWFGTWMCLNVTNTNKTVYVLLLDDESQELMRVWTDNFEQYLEENGVELLSKPRRYGQPFHSTVAIFDIYNQNVQVISVETIDYLNEEYANIWKTIPITFSRENMDVS